MTDQIIQQHGAPFEIIMPDNKQIEALVRRREALVTAIQTLFKPGVHYSAMPGVTPKPGEPERKLIKKEGIELLCHLFLLVPDFADRSTDLPGGHRECTSVCRLVHGPSGRIVAMFTGICTTMESKYRYRYADYKCPECGKENTIRRSKRAEEGGWYCWAKIGGCGAKFAVKAPEIVAQVLGRIENPDPADSYHTVNAMAQKRALGGAVRLATAVGDIFTDEFEAEMEGAAEEKASAAAEAELLVGARIKESPWAKLIAAWLGAKDLPAEPTVLQMHGLLDRLETLEYTPEQFTALVGRCNRHIGVMLGTLDVEIKRAAKATVGGVADLAEAVADMVSDAPAQTPAAERPKRGPGRPAGSKNRPKADADAAAPPNRPGETAQGMPAQNGPAAAEIDVARDLVGEPRPKCVGAGTLGKFGLVVDSYPDGPRRLRELLDERGADRVAALQPEPALAILNVIRAEADKFDASMAEDVHDPEAAAALDEFGLGADEREPESE